MFSDVMNVPRGPFDEAGEHDRSQFPVDAAEPSAVRLAADDDERPRWCEQSPELSEGLVPPMSRMLSNRSVVSLSSSVV
jgi:hypothetical protein